MEGVQQMSTLLNNGQDDLQIQTKGQTDVKLENESSPIEELIEFSKEKTPARKISPRKALRKITEEEQLYQTCSRCRRLCGRICETCDVPLEWIFVMKQAKQRLGVAEFAVKQDITDGPASKQFKAFMS